MQYSKSFEKCSICGRRFLVERILFGANHTSSIIITCRRHLLKKGISKMFKKTRPKEAGEVEQWLSEPLERSE